MINKERKLAKAVDTPNRCRAFTEAVYSGVSDNPEKLKKEVFEANLMLVKYNLVLFT